MNTQGESVAKSLIDKTFPSKNVFKSDNSLLNNGIEVMHTQGRSHYHYEHICDEKIVEKDTDIFIKLSFAFLGYEVVIKTNGFVDNPKQILLEKYKAICNREPICIDTLKTTDESNGSLVVKENPIERD